MAKAKNQWMGMVCDAPQHQRACLSWFSAMVPDTWGLPLKADILSDAETDQTKQLRALFRLPDGSLRQATRRFNKRNAVIVIGTPTSAILKGWRDPAAKTDVAA
jgi:hypothetical protein